MYVSRGVVALHTDDLGLSCMHDPLITVSGLSPVHNQGWHNFIPKKSLWYLFIGNTYMSVSKNFQELYYYPSKYHKSLSSHQGIKEILNVSNVPT